MYIADDVQVTTSLQDHISLAGHNIQTGGLQGLQALQAHHDQAGPWFLPPPSHASQGGFDSRQRYPVQYILMSYDQRVLGSVVRDLILYKYSVKYCLYH